MPEIQLSPPRDTRGTPPRRQPNSTTKSHHPTERRQTSNSNLKSGSAVSGPPTPPRPSAVRRDPRTANRSQPTARWAAQRPNPPSGTLAISLANPNARCVRRRHWKLERRAGFEPAALRLCRPFPWSARAPAQGLAAYRWREGSPTTHCVDVMTTLSTVSDVAMTLRLTDEEHDALRVRAALDGISMQEAVRRAVREYVTRADHRDRVAAAADVIVQHHADALRRLGE